uniref:Cytochrome b561 domain-containing protein n=1 Tax=Steinernema glaseri TaxID=37863 RepID=A0A1I7YA47_9BILA
MSSRDVNYYYFGGRVHLKTLTVILALITTLWAFGQIVRLGHTTLFSPHPLYPRSVIAVHTILNWIHVLAGGLAVIAVRCEEPSLLLPLTVSEVTRELSYVVHVVIFEDEMLNMINKEGGISITLTQFRLAMSFVFLLSFAIAAMIIYVLWQCYRYLRSIKYVPRSTRSHPNRREYREMSTMNVI